MNRKRLYIVGAVIVVVLAVIIFSVMSKPDKKNGAANGNTGSNSKTTGKVICLPKKGSSAKTDECAYGIKTSDGKYYAVRVKGKDGGFKDGGLESYPTDVTLTLTGAIASPKNQPYDIDGVIDITDIKE